MPNELTVNLQVDASAECLNRLCNGLAAAVKPSSVARGCYEAAAEAESGSSLQQLLVAAGDLLERVRPAAPPSPEVQRDAVIAAVTEALGNAYDCQRVWQAWSVGTMCEDDFALVAEDPDRVAEIADAAIEAMRPTTSSEPEVVSQPYKLPESGEVAGATCKITGLAWPQTIGDWNLRCAPPTAPPRP